MLANDYIVVSPYATMVQEQLERWRGQEVMNFNQSMLAHELGRRVTVSMRRCLAELETAGIIARFRYTTPKNGIGVGYTIVQRVSPEKYKAEMPF